MNDIPDLKTLVDELRPYIRPGNAPGSFQAMIAGYRHEFTPGDYGVLGLLARVLAADYPPTPAAGEPPFEASTL